MPIKPENKKRYPRYWKELSIYIRTILAENKCEFCNAENYKSNPITGSKVILTVAHLNQMPEENDRLNLRALCQKCHFAHDRQFRNKIYYNPGEKRSVK